MLVVNDTSKIWGVVSNRSVMIRIQREVSVEMEGSKAATMHLEDYREGAVEERSVHEDTDVGEIAQADVINKYCLL